MSDRIYLPPRIGDSTPPEIFTERPGRPFIRIRKRRHRRGGGTTLSRNIAIFIDGACPGNGTPLARAGVGVYFGPESDHNISERLWGGTQTNQRAEVNAAIYALDKVKLLLINGELRAKTVVLVSDSSYLVNGITDWVKRLWQKNGWTNSNGNEVANKDDFQRLNSLVDELKGHFGVYVKFWHVYRENNKDADGLARDSVA